MKIPYQQVEIHWHDPMGDSSWVDPNSALDPQPCVTLGWIVKETPLYYHIASTMGVNSEGLFVVSDRNYIPKGTVLKIIFKGHKKKEETPCEASTKS